MTVPMVIYNNQPAVVVIEKREPFILRPIYEIRTSTGGAGGSYLHIQSVAQSVWTVNHNLGYKPGGINAFESTGDQIEGLVDHLNDDTLTITFSASVSGEAYVS